MSYPERIVPGETAPGILALHLARYVFAERWCDDGEVLDLGCGTGYGSFRLSRVARKVIGGDISVEAVEYARGHYGAPNLEFAVLDATVLPFGDASFDVVCSFETIEHVDNPKKLVHEVARVLRPGGTFVVSTPRAEETTHKPANPHHRVEFARADFERLLGGAFGSVELYGERRIETRRHTLLRRLDVLGLRRRSALLRRAAAFTGTPATENVALDDVIVTREHVDTARVMIAVCSR